MLTLAAMNGPKAKKTAINVMKILKENEGRIKYIVLPRLCCCIAAPMRRLMDREGHMGIIRHTIMTDRRSRSLAYQHLFFETPWQDYYDEVLVAPDSFVDFDAKERVYELKEELFKRVVQLGRQNLTATQLQYFELAILGLHQTEIAKRTKKSQSTINKAFIGCWFKRRTKTRIYKWGGINQKIKKLCDDDIPTQRILAELRELSNS